MKRSVVFLCAALIVLSVVAVTFGESDYSDERSDMGMMRRGSDIRKGMMTGKMFMKPEIIATSDGGIVVFIANTLIKYDRKLNLVNKVQLDIDMEAIKEQYKEKIRERMDRGTDN